MTNRKIFFLSAGIIFFTVLFYFIYFAGNTCSGLEVNKSTIINIHYERGMRFYRQHEYDKAISELEKVLKIEPGHIKAKKYLAAATKSMNKNILEQLCKQADVFYKQKEYQKAMDTYKKALEVVPADAYASYRMELLNAKIERLEEAKKNTQAKLKQSKKELQRFAKEREKRERLLKKRAEAELNKEEKEEQKKQARILKENIDNKDTKQQKVLTENIAIENERQEARLVKRALRPDTTTLSKDVEQDAFLSEQMKELEKLYRIKFLFELGEKYYNEAEYRRAIETFQQVIDLEASPRVFYTPYAQDYIEKAKGKLEEQVSKDRVREIEDMENEMINKVIDAKRTPSEQKR